MPRIQLLSSHIESYVGCQILTHIFTCSVSKEDILQYGLRNKPKSMKFIAKASSRSIFLGFLHIHTLHLTTFLKVKNTVHSAVLFQIGKNARNSPTIIIGQQTVEIHLCATGHESPARCRHGNLCDSSDICACSGRLHDDQRRQSPHRRAGMLSTNAFSHTARLRSHRHESEYESQAY